MVVVALDPVAQNPSWVAVVDRVSTELAAGGFDRVEPFAVGDVAEALGAFSLESFGRPRALGVVVGNSRALWEPFVAALGEPPGPDPLDGYTERIVRRAAAASGVGHRVVFGHHTRPGATLPIQRLAEASGMCVTSPSHLSVDPTLGPWWALRAAITFDLDGPPSRSPRRRAPCHGCAAPCVPALEAALAAAEPLDARGIAAAWERWVAVRDACPVGRAHRYSLAQIRYHYTKAADALAPPDGER